MRFACMLSSESWWNHGETSGGPPRRSRTKCKLLDGLNSKELGGDPTGLDLAGGNQPSRCFNAMTLAQHHAD